MSVMTGPAPTPENVLSRAWYWLQTHPKFRWVLLFLAICTMCYNYNTGVAMADTGDVSARTLFLPLGSLTDTHGVPVWRYTELPFDPGNGTYVIRAIRSMIASFAWALYVIPILLVVALLNWILEFEWLEWLASPFITLSDGISNVLSTWMIVTLGVLVSAIIIGFGYVRGRMGAATVEFIMVVIVFGMAASPLANPLTYLTGEDGGVTSGSGMIREAAGYGEEAGSLAINPDGEVEAPSLAGSAIDLTMRNPMLTMSFGSPLDGDCAAQWDDSAKDGSLSADDIRKKVIKCDEEVADANQTASGIWFMHYILAIPGTIGIMFLIAVFLGFLIYQVIQVLITSVIAIIRSYFALFSGAARQAWFHSLAQVFVSVVLVGMFIFALTVYMWVLNAIVGKIPPGLIQLGSIVIGLIVIFLAITFWKMRKSGKKISERIAKALGKNGLQKNAEMKPSRFGSTVGNLAKKAASKSYDFYRTNKIARGVAAATRTGAAVATGGAGAAAATAATTVAKRAGIQAALPPGNGKAAAMAAPSAKTRKSVSRDVFKSQAASTQSSASEVSVARGQAIRGTTLPTGTKESVDRALQPPVPSANEYKATSIPEGRYGSTWVHADGTITNPVTITPDGEQAQNVPSEDKMVRAMQDGDAWVISPDVAPRADRPNTPVAKPSQGIQPQAQTLSNSTSSARKYRGAAQQLRTTTATKTVSQVSPVRANSPAPAKEPVSSPVVTKKSMKPVNRAAYPASKTGKAATGKVLAPSQEKQQARNSQRLTNTPVRPRPVPPMKNREAKLSPAHQQAQTKPAQKQDTSIRPQAAKFRNRRGGN